MQEKNNTIEYYDNNARAFAEGTESIEFSAVDDRFLKNLSKGALILDLGCGAGRDTKYFLEHGFFVDAVDGSEEMCRIASENTGTKVRQMLFQEFNETEKYDGIFACASLLHLKKDELPDMFFRIQKALKNNGIFYCSFKYGDFEGEKNDRYFTYLTKETLREILDKVTGFSIIDEWISSDARKGREDEKWVNVICRKRYQ